MPEIIILRQLSPNDDKDCYEMLQHIDKVENAFHNPANGMSFEEFKKWLKQQDDWSRNENLPAGYVGQTCFWLVVDNVPVGFGKIRHALTSQSKQIGGNIGYAVSSLYRGKGYGSILLHKLLEKADEMRVEEKLLTVEKYNYASKRVIEKNGGQMVLENDYRWFFEF